MNEFRMLGRIIEIYRYKVTYLEKEISERAAQIEKTVEAFSPSLEEANALATRKGGIVSALQTANLEWLNGLEVDDVPDTYGEAVKIAKMGENAYKLNKQIKSAESTDKLRADVDYVMLMGGF